MSRRLLCLGLLAATMLAPAATAAAAPPPIKHVVVVWLENESYVSTFGPNTKARFFTQDLAAKGQLLTQYYATGHLSLDNYISVVSGQPPNVQTQADCLRFTDFAGTVGADGIAVGQGCVYPKGVQTIADQLEAKGLTWKGYMQDMGSACRHPAINAMDDTQQAKVGDQYATRHNPFMYFHSVIDEPSCASSDVDLKQLETDFASEATTPNFSFITPNLCEDGHDEPCVDGRPGGLESADEFLSTYIPKIMSSPAMKKDGLLMVSFDEAEASGPVADASACCGEPAGPNTPNPGGPEAGPGGGRIGGVVLSPYVKAGTMNNTPYNHYSFLRSVEDIFGLSHLGYAAQEGLQAFGADVYGGPGPLTPPESIGEKTTAPCVGTSLRKDGVLSRARVRDRRLELRTLRTVRLRASVRTSSGRRVRVRSRVLRECQSYRIALRPRGGRVSLELRRGRKVLERRTVRY